MTGRNRSGRLIIGGLFALFVCLYVYLLPEMPLYGDEIGNAQRMVENRWHLFDLYRYYRIIGISTNFLAYKVTAAAPQALTLILTVWVLICVGFFSSLFARVFAKGNAVFTLAVCLIFLALPFSFYLLLLRVVFHEMVTVTLILLCFLLIERYATDPRNTRMLWVIPVLYAVSLFCYEASALLPISMALFAWLIVPSAGRRGAVRIIVSGAMCALALYLSIQFLNYASNPKLSISAADYASYNIGLTRGEQILRAVLFLVYHVRWSFQYLLQSAGAWPFAAFAAVAAYLVLVIVALRRIAREGVVSVDSISARKAVAVGTAVAVCSFGLWSYYWVFKGSMVLPPLYNLYVPSIGTALACAAALSLVRRRSVVCLACLAIFGGIVLNTTILLSSRAAITNTSKETRILARQVKESFGQGLFRHRAVVLPPMDPDGNYARRKARFESMFRQYVSEEYGSRYNGLIAVAVRDCHDGEVTIMPHGIRLPLSDVMIFDREAGRLVTSVSGRRAEVDRSPAASDRFGVRLAGYRLEYSLERGNVILSKSGDEL